MMPGETTIIIVSDLHLASGNDPSSGQRDPMEPFAQDAAFTSWLDHVRERAAISGGNHRLLLLGDIFDFPRVRFPDAAGVSSQDAERVALAKLDSIAAGHPAVFAALGRWLGDGIPIDLVPGNHDVELMRPAVHAHLGDLLARAAGLSLRRSHIGVYPWVYHVPGLLYAEHGQQYHDINSFPALVWLESQSQTVGNMTLGAAVDTFAQRVTARLGPEVDAPDSVLSLLRNIARTGPRGIARVAPDFARLVITIGRDLATRWMPQHRARRERYRADMLPNQAEQTGIPADTLAQIDRLAESTANRLLVRMAGMSWRRRPSSGSRGTRPPAHYLERAANEVQRVLSGAGVGTAFYVFGHSHRAVQRSLGDGESGAAYFNSGTWAWQSADAGPLLTFVTVTLDPVRGEATAALQKWNDDLHRIETVGEPTHIPVGLAGSGPA